MLHSAALRLKALLVAENLCLRQQLPVLQRGTRRRACAIGPVVLDLRQSMVRWLAPLGSYCETRDRPEMASTGLACLLVGARRGQLSK